MFDSCFYTFADVSKRLSSEDAKYLEARVLLSIRTNQGRYSGVGWYAKGSKNPIKSRRYYILPTGWILDLKELYLCLTLTGNQKRDPSDCKILYRPDELAAKLSPNFTETDTQILNRVLREVRFDGKGRYLLNYSDRHSYWHALGSFQPSLIESRRYYVLPSRWIVDVKKLPSCETFFSRLEATFVGEFK